MDKTVKTVREPAITVMRDYSVEMGLKDKV
jgi:hypothetical protein